MEGKRGGKVSKKINELRESISLVSICIFANICIIYLNVWLQIFSWVQNKLTSNKSNIIPDNNHTKQPCKEEFNDWPHGLLAIGTLGNKIKQEADQKANLHQSVPSTQDHVNYLHGLTAEEVGKLQKELNLIFQEHGPTSPANLEAPSIPFDRFLDADSSTVEDEERVCSGCSDGSNSSNRKDDHHLQYCNSSLVQSRGKDMCSDNSKAAIGKKSLSFLLKKMFVCRSGFSPAPISLRDPAVMESRMEKVLNTDTLINVEGHTSQEDISSNYSSKLSTKKSLESCTHISNTANGDEKIEKADDGSKWVKTDSECKFYMHEQFKSYNLQLLKVLT
ncbi:hypothetical protein CXB51_014648 [Gossypium anomalum]|uniref:Uncharacterized protein n=1 Tax=Gossypium anomalum TaxID=47600 RepID=A0A8J6D501_9ROSI|nr:hypothetical protein CXB51_014648 [Gossypium anomalum]